jgi:hypothetical protein
MSIATNMLMRVNTMMITPTRISIRTKTDMITPTRMDTTTTMLMAAKIITTALAFGAGSIRSSIFYGHSHQQQQRAADPALADNAEGIRTVWLALGALGLTTIIQIVIVYLSGSVALFADTVHNLGDSLNSIPLLIAFYLARRVATRRLHNLWTAFGPTEQDCGVNGIPGLHMARQRAAALNDLQTKAG